MRYQAPRGTADLLPSDSHRWQHVEAIFREVAARYGYQEIRTPIFEDTELFKRTAGETSDIVTKEMYIFEDKGGRSCTLRPEGTAPAMRAVLEHSLCPPGTILRLSYMISIFRYGRPQRGRLRQAHQFGCELIGSASATADAEIIEFVSRFTSATGLTQHEVVVNSIGRGECRAKYRDAILNHTAAWLSDQPEDVRERVQKNPLGLLDSKDPSAQEALKGVPAILDYLEDDSRARFEKVQQILTDANVPFRVDPMVVRGLDYYTETVFEGVTDLLPGLSIFGGGRYDNLIQELGGSATPSVGFGLGIERLLLALEKAELVPSAPVPDVFLVQATPDAETVCLNLSRSLRDSGVAVLTDLDARSMKSQLRQADKAKARFALIVGTDELAKGVVQIRDLAKSEQLEVPFDNAVARILELK